MLVGNGDEGFSVDESRVDVLRRLFGRFRCFRFWECRSFGGWEILATKNTKVHKEGARPAPKGVQWFCVAFHELLLIVDTCVLAKRNEDNPLYSCVYSANRMFYGLHFQRLQL